MKITDRLKSNDKIVIKNIFGAFFIKGLALLISLVSMPIYIRFFDDNLILGLWFTILSVLSWVLTFDFGIGNGLRNKLVISLSKNNKNMVRKYISSSYILLGFIVIGFILILTPIILALNWNEILNVEASYISPKTLLFIILINFSTIIIQFYLRLITFIIYALQKSALNNLLLLITTVSQLLFILLYPSGAPEHNLIVLSFVHFICVVLPLIVVTFIIFKRKLSYAIPKMKFYDFNIGKSVLSLGGKFFIIQVFYLGLTGSNVFIISNVLSPIDVVEYQVYYRIFSLMGMLTMLLLTPFWSIITKAKEEKEWFWIKKYFNLFSILSILIFVLNISIMFLFQYIINIWLGDESFNANSFYLIVFGFYGWIFSIQAFVSVFANGFNRINNQLFIYTIGFIVKITMIYGFTLFIKNWGVIIFIDLIIFIVYDIFEYFSVKKYINFNIKIT